MKIALKDAIHKADKHARNKKYRCLAPRCEAHAVRCHSIPRAAIAEALAENGVVYTQRPSLASSLTALGDATDFIEVGVNDAGVFAGYCAKHDAEIFSHAEKMPLAARGPLSLYVRALSLEYCRKRYVRDHNRRVFELTGEPWSQAEAQLYDRICEFQLSRLYLGGAIEYFGFAFPRNINVSCCGCSTYDPANPFRSTIAFNLVSLADVSFLIISVAKDGQKYLDDLVAKYTSPKGTHRLLNDIAFSRCEEPMVSPRLWRSLSEHTKLQVHISLLPPALRAGSATPEVIKPVSGVAQAEWTPAMKARLGFDPGKEFHFRGAG